MMLQYDFNAKSFSYFAEVIDNDESSRFVYNSDRYKWLSDPKDDDPIADKYYRILYLIMDLLMLRQYLMTCSLTVKLIMEFQIYNVFHTLMELSKVIQEM